MRLSNSKLEMYSQCAKKYRFQYIDNLKPDLTPSPLLFGSAIDFSLNYILVSIKDGKEYSIDKAKELFLEQMNKWDGSNPLDYFKNELPEGIDEDHPEVQELVWDNLCKKGIAMIDTYVKYVLPQFKSIIGVQLEHTVTNDENDQLVFIVDFIAEMQDGRKVLFDNKTASQPYPKNKVLKSQQLSLYSEYFEVDYCGYIVLLKKPHEKHPDKYQILIDKIPEETKQESFDNLEKTLYAIKNEQFDPNYKSCFAYGKPCGYLNYCKRGIKKGLVPYKNEKL